MSRGQQPTGRKSKTKHGFMLTEHCALPSGKDLKKARAVSKINSAPLSAVPDKATAVRRRAGFVERKPGHAGSAISRAPAGSESVLSVQDEEAEAFLRAMNQVQPLQARGREVTPEPCRSNLPPPQAALSLQDYLDGKLEFALSFSDEYLEGHVVGLDQMIMNKLRAGALSRKRILICTGSMPCRPLRPCAVLCAAAGTKGCVRCWWCRAGGATRRTVWECCAKNCKAG